MSALGSLWLSEKKLETLLNTVRKKQIKGVEITLSINDQTDQYGQNIASYVAQSKEDREAKKERFYIGNGKIFWNNGSIVNAVKPNEAEAQAEASTPQQESDDEDLPF